MKTKNILSAFVFLFTVSLATGCSDDNENKAEPYLNFEDSELTVNIGIEGINKNNRKSVLVRSNREWQIVLSPEDSEWIHIFVDEGKDDGIFYYWVDSNPAFTGRKGVINVMSGSEKLNAIEVVQDANVPTIAIINAENGYTALPAKGVVKVPVTGNIEWTSELEQVDWARIESMKNDTIYVAVDKNTGDKRTVTLTVTGSGEFNNLSSTTTITQSAPGIVFYERFDWMQQGKEDFYYNYPEVNFTKWTEAEKSHGWTTMGDCMYGGRGYIKIGKTNVAGDAVSPKLEALKAATDVVVTFKCIGYMASNGKKDDGVLNIGLIGSGQVEGGNVGTLEIGGTNYRVATFDITVFPDSPSMEHGEGYNPWEESNATHTFRIKGADSTTQIVFVGGAKWGTALKGVGQGKNRLLIDDVKVQEAE